MVAADMRAANEHSCMTGTPRKQEKVEKARESAIQTMQTYFAAMKNGSAPRSAFFVLRKETLWTAGSKSVGRKQIDQPTDFLAALGTELIVEPVSFVRSGLDANALGQWQVLAESGDLAGTYTAFFVRKRGQWKFRQLTLSRADEYIDPVVQYCHEQGDILPYRLRHAERQVAYWGRRILKAEAKLERYEARALKAETRAAKRPKNATIQEKAQLVRRRAFLWQEKLAERSMQLESALEVQATAIADAKLSAARATETKRRLESETGQ